MLAGHIDKSHIHAHLALSVGNGQRHFGLAHPGQALQHHDGMELQVLLQLLHALRLVHIAGAAGRQRQAGPMAYVASVASVACVASGQADLEPQTAALGLAQRVGPVDAQVGDQTQQAAV